MNVCEQSCINLSNEALEGFVCSCNPGFRLVKHDNVDENNYSSADGISKIKSHSCEDINECESVKTHHCSQICINIKGSYECNCNINYVDQDGDGNICKAPNNEDIVIFFSIGQEIRQIRDGLSSYNSLIQYQSVVTSLELDVFDRHLYWIDSEKSKIKRTFIPVSKKAFGNEQVLNNFDMIKEQNLKFTAISVDWMNKNLYFAESTLSTIRVSKTDGRYSKTLIKENANNVLSMIVNPTIGYI